MRVYIEVGTPGNGKTYEFKLDSGMTVRQAKLRMIEEITEVENGNITLNPAKVILNSLNMSKRLSDTDTLAAAGIKSGQALLLI